MYAATSDTERVSSNSRTPDTMSSYLSNLLTQTTTHYKSIRRTLLSNEEDGDTEDDSHITRVLRAYYMEKGRPFPPWLPPDPNEKQAITPQPFTQPIVGYFNQATGRNQPATMPPQQNPSSGRSSLSDLWDGPNAAPMQPQSLRNTRKPAPAPAPMSYSPNNLAPPPQARPLPSQRVGSYQTMQAQAPSRPSFEPTPPSSSGGGTAQDRLKARLWGGSGGKPGSPANGGYQPPSSSGNPYASSGGYGR